MHSHPEHLMYTLCALHVNSKHVHAVHVCTLCVHLVCAHVVCAHCVHVVCAHCVCTGCVCIVCTLCVCTVCAHVCAYCVCARCVHVHIVCAHRVCAHMCVCTRVCMLGVGAHSGRSSEGQGWLWGWAGEGLQRSALRACLPGPAAQLTQAQGERIACRDLEAHGSPWAGTCTGCWCHSDTLALASHLGRDEGGRSWGPLLPFDI